MSESASPLTCAFHPQTETRLRCNRCEKPICIKCAKRTPTGYRCPECISNQQKVFITAEWHDYLTSTLIAGILSFLGSLVTGAFGFYTIFIAPIAAAIIVAVVRKVIKNRRSPRLYWVVAASALIGSLPLLFLDLISFLLMLETLPVGMGLSLVWRGLYSIITTTTVYYKIR
ncbi:MAG: hypothetical protein B6I38_04325 [Anaerolineaceae bacterium 4572_5.1]|nr:MAG: hypothetical protein B6I38_04325 [Anaerolineaceae bacterium 4572_5.1]